MSSIKIIDEKGQTLEPINQTLCEICQNQFSNYVCPRCNLRYCSLACYKDLQHADCTESFYRDSVTAEIQSRDLDPDSKNKMMAMLQRLEEQNEAAADLLEDDDEEAGAEEQEELVSRFANIDIENADSSLIWGLLSDKQREEFEAALVRVQHSGTYDGLDILEYMPWWNKVTLIQDTEEETEKNIPSLPHNLPDFDRMTQVHTRESPHLIWNLLNILSTYSYIMRYSIGEIGEDIQHTIEIAKCVSANVIFSNAAGCPYSGAADVVGDIAERITQLEDKTDMKKRLNNSKRYDLKLLLFQDLIDLLRESKRAVYHFWTKLDGVKKKNRILTLAVRKLYFYFAFACHLDSKRVELIQGMIRNELSKTQIEKEEFQKDFNAAEDVIQKRKEQKEAKEKIIIQEL